MFAKLKKKVQEEIGAKGDVSAFPGGPGLASPVQLEPPSREYESPSSIASSTEDLNKDNGSDIPQNLHAKNDKIKSLQSKIIDLTSILKERNRQIDNLENALERQQDKMAKKIQDMNEQYQSNRLKMSEEYQQGLQKKNEELKKSNGDLLERLKLAEKYRDRFFKRGEETDEIAGFVTQELAKVKHMLLIAQEELGKTKSELGAKTSELDTTRKRLKDSENEVHSLMEQITSLTTTSETNEEEDIKFKNQLKDKDALMKRLETLTTKYSQAKTEFKALRQSHAVLQNEHDTLLRNTDLHRNKTTSLVESKDEEITHLQERIGMLDNRLQDASLSGDERMKALERERGLLEKKLEESREQLNQVKTTWSDKITSLENQIAKLNSKIADDAMELSTVEKQKEQSNFNNSELKSKLERLETRYRNELSEKENTLLEKKRKYESELADVAKKSFGIEAEFTARVSSLESDVTRLQKVIELEKEKLQMEQDEWLEKEIDAERKINSLENELERVQKDLGQKEQGQQHISSQLQSKDKEIKELTKKTCNLETDIKTKDSKVEQLHNSIKKLQADYHISVKEKDELMLRNAQLSQDFETHKLKVRNDRVGLEKDLQLKNASIAGLEQSIQDLQSDMSASEQKVKDLQQQHSLAMSAFETEELDKQKAEVTILEAQVADKTKTIKMQQQRLADLKKTLHRELKVQALPNDDILESVHSSNGGYMSERGGRAGPPQPAKVDSRTNNVPTLTPSASVPSSINSLAVLNSLAALTPKHMVDTSPYSANARYQMLNYTGANMPPPSVQYHIADDPFADCRDVNFQYLKHVVMKFLLSQESESLKLIKAIAMLLQFNPDEQKVVKETLEWKMSWFGAKPKLGKGQLARVIPPPY